MTQTLEHTARRIAERGRDALVARLRPTFQEAAAAHADVLELSDDQIELMVQRAADRADGLQWRRALAGVATEELGIGLGEALGHPAVTRAQAIVGAPPYEKMAAEIMPAGEAVPEPEPAPEPDAAPEPEPAPEPDATPEPEPAPEPDATPEPEPTPEPDATAEPDATHEPEPAAEPEPATPIATATAEHPAVQAPVPVPVELLYEPEPAEALDERGISIPAVHLGGIANLRPGAADIELCFSDYGLLVVREKDDAVLARMGWEDIHSIEVPETRGRKLRRRQAGAQLVVRSEFGDASFEIPGATADELRNHLAPVLGES